MAINKKLIHFDTYSNFNSQKLSANKENTQYTVGVNGSVITGNPTILYQSICFIKDESKIWTHGALYDCANQNSQISESITYSEFVAKVDNGELMEGCLYRITDYETVVTGDSLTTAPDHGFDLIVLATSSNSYSNKCWATPTERYQYPPYVNCQLDKWQIWWSHERTNQIWVPEAGHKGVIYRMIDEWGNDCPYDFKSIMLKVPAIVSDVNGTLGTVENLADSYYPTFTIMIDSEIQDASVYLNSFEDNSTFCANNVIKSSIVDGYNDEDSSPFPYVMFLASCGDTYSDLSSKRIYNNVIGESTTGVLFFAECNYFNFSNNSIGKNSQGIRLIARQDDLQNTGTILNNNFGGNCEYIFLEASDISNNSIDSGSYDIRIPTTEGIPRTPYQGILDLRIGKNVGSISTDFGVEKQEYVYLTDLHVGDSSYDIHFNSSYGTPVDGFSTNIGKSCSGLYIDLTYSPTVNIGDRCTDITVNGTCTIGDGCSSIEYSSETGASQLTFNSGVHDLFINPLDGIKATVIAGSPTGSADDIVDQTVAKPENGPDNADYLLYVNGQNKWVAEPIVSLDKVVKYQDNSSDLKSIRVDLLEDGMVYALPLGGEEAKAYADCVLQEKIDDLDAIRRGAAKGATALQSYTEQYKGTITGVSANGTSVATSGVANIPAASTSAYGVTKLTSATNSTSTTLAATASAVKAAYDLANNYKGTVTGVKINGSTKNPSSGVVDLGTVITSHQDISGKQDKLVSGTNIKTINGTSILGSGNIVISGGGSSGGSGAYAQVYHGIGDTTFTLTPNTFHVWDEVASLDLTIGDEVVGILNEFIFQFTSGDTATSLVLPDSIVWDELLMILPKKIYQVSILNGLATTLMWAYSKGGKIINFTVNGNVSFGAEEGMSWEDFINSDYNTNIPGLNDKYFVIEDDLPKFALLYEGEVDRYEYILSGYASTAEQLDDIIINNNNYMVS